METIEKYRLATNKLILLDYDGILVDYPRKLSNAKPSGKLLDILITIVNKPQTKVIIISGRAHRDIDKLVGHLPIDIIAEHGAMIKKKGQWGKGAIDNGLWKNVVLPVFNRITLKCPESFVEEKQFSLAWHYRNSDPESGYVYSRELIKVLRSTIRSFDLKLLDSNNVVEIMSKEIGTGIAVKNLTAQYNYDYILSIGDNKTDEEVFEYLLHDTNAITIKVGAGNTLAKYKLDKPGDVISLLEQLSACD